MPLTCRKMAEHIASNPGLEAEDFELPPFKRRPVLVLTASESDSHGDFIALLVAPVQPHDYTLEITAAAPATGVLLDGDALFDHSRHTFEALAGRIARSRRPHHQGSESCPKSAASSAS